MTIKHRLVIKIVKLDIKNSKYKSNKNTNQ